MYRWDVMEGDVYVYIFLLKNIENDLNILGI